jgi:hypothetical protein
VRLFDFAFESLDPLDVARRRALADVAAGQANAEALERAFYSACSPPNDSGYRRTFLPQGRPLEYQLMVMERADYTLDEYIEREPDSALRDSFMLPVLAQLACTEHSLLALHFSHQDLHIKNVMLARVEPSLRNASVHYVLSAERALQVPLAQCDNMLVKLTDVGFSTARFVDTSNVGWHFAPALDRYATSEARRLMPAAGLSLAPAFDLARLAVSFLYALALVVNRRTQAQPPAERARIIHTTLQPLTRTFQILQTMLRRQPDQVTAQLARDKLTHLHTFLAQPTADNFPLLVAVLANGAALVSELVCTYNEHDALPYDVCEALHEHHITPPVATAAQTPARTCLDMTVRPPLRQRERFMPDTVVRSDARLAPIASANAQWELHRRSNGPVMESERAAPTASPR